MAQTNVDPEVVGTGRIVKRRASRACLSCRAKKIKCSVVKSGIPCHNCRLDENECVVSERRRKRFRIEEPPPNHSTESPIAGVEQTDVQETLSAIDRSLATAPTSLDLEAHIFRWLPWLSVTCLGADHDQTAPTERPRPTKDGHF